MCIRDRTNAVGRPSVVTDNLVEKVNVKVRKNCRFTISELSFQFHEVSYSLIHEIVTEKLGYKKLCARWVPKMLTDVHRQMCGSRIKLSAAFRK